MRFPGDNKTITRREVPWLRIDEDHWSHYCTPEGHVAVAMETNALQIARTALEGFLTEERELNSCGHIIDLRSGDGPFFRITLADRRRFEVGVREV